MRPIPKSSIGVSIADDSSAVCKLIAHLLQRESSIHIVGVAELAELALFLVGTRRHRDATEPSIS